MIPGLPSIRDAVPLITTIVGTHIAFSVASITRAGIPLGGLQAKEEECFDAKHYNLVTDFVARMYRGRGIKAVEADRSSGRNILGVRLAPTVVFEDPAAVCVGEEKVREAFRALRLLDPVSLSPPRCIDVEPRGSSIKLTFRLNQQYTLPVPLPGSRPFQISLRSLLMVTVQLQQMNDVGLPESEFLVTEMTELWHGNPLLWPYLLFYVPRRLNGVVSYYLTSRFS